MLYFRWISFFFKLFIFFFWLCWVFVSVWGLSLVAASGGHSSSRCTGLSLSWPLLLRSTGSRRAGSVVVAHGSSCSAACGIFPDQDSNPCRLHWQADSQPLCHHGSPDEYLLRIKTKMRVWEFPGCPVVRTWRFHCRAWVWSLVGELRSCKPCVRANKQTNKTKTKTKTKN